MKDLDIVAILGILTGMIAILCFFSTIFFSYFYYLRFRNKERLLMIENKIDISEFYKKPKREGERQWYMIGFTLLGIGLGFLIALIIISFFSLEENVAVWLFISLPILLGALGIITGHNFEQKKKKLRG